MQNKMPAWTVSEIIQNAGRLGIPHFQRGLVWGSDSVGALLESLYYDTPCGSFVLWAPKRPERYGVALDPSRDAPFDELIIDGQQRIRSLYDVYGDAAKRDPGRIWCINLTQLRELRSLLVAQQREYPLFVSVGDPATLKDKDAGGALRRNLCRCTSCRRMPAGMPQRWRHTVELLSALTHQKDALQQQMPTIYEKIHQNVLRMQDRLFSISLQKSDDVGEMASLYNRINSGGKRVDVEERAFAKLVGLQPSTYTHLDDLFRAIHPADSEFALQRDQLLTRQKERAFGFKLFIRVFLQVCQHHLGFLYGKVDVTFDLANRASFAAAFGALSEPDVAELWRHTRRVVTTVRDVLRDQLYCDDLRFLPEANCLAPVFQLLIHYPELSHDEYRSLLARLCLHLCLAEPDSKSMTTLVNLAANNRKLADAVLREMFETLEKRNSPKELAKRLEGANSIQSRYVLMLYWLQRSLGAEDFRYAQVAESKTLIKPEAVLSQKVKAEKQHLLPFQKAQLIYGTDLGRGESHIVNGIGNLTYISRALNDFIGGLGERFALLDLEPPENKRAHLLCDESASDGVLGITANSSRP